MIHEMICPVCGKKFTTTSGTAKYCSSYCRLKAYRRRLVADVRQEDHEKSDKWKEQRAAQSKQRRDEMERAAADGDPFSRMQLAKRFFVEYFEALRDYEIQYADQSGKPSTCEINGISIYSDNFPEDAAAAVAEDGVCVTRR